MPRSAFDYDVESTLVFTADAIQCCLPNPYVPFQLASHAIRYAVEEFAPVSPRFIYLEVKGKHYDETRIRELYDAPSYPLNRSNTVSRLPWPSVTDDWPAIG